MSKVAWIVGRYYGEGAGGHSTWGLIGVFQTKTEALAACLETHDFYAAYQTGVDYTKSPANPVFTYPAEVDFAGLQPET